MELALYFYFRRMHLFGSWIGIVLEQTVLALPFVLVNVHASLQACPLMLERAVRTSAPGPGPSFRITLTIIRSGMLAGALLAFMMSFDEIVIALFLVGPGTTTMPVKIWFSMRSGWLSQTRPYWEIADDLPFISMRRSASPTTCNDLQHFARSGGNWRSEAARALASFRGRVKAKARICRKTRPELPGRSGG